MAKNDVTVLTIVFSNGLTLKKQANAGKRGTCRENAEHAHTSLVDHAIRSYFYAVARR